MITEQYNAVKQLLDIKQKGIFVQIGVNYSNDDFLQISKDSNPQKIILIDPLTQYNDLIKEYYKDYNYIKIDAAVVSDPNINKIQLYFPGNDYKRTGHATIVPMVNWKANQLTPNSVSTVYFNKIMIDHNIKDIELLMLDTEGNDYDILDSIDFDNISIRNIIFENWKFPTKDCYSEKYYKNYGLDGRKYILDKLKTKGYDIHESYTDFFCILNG